MTLPKSDTKTLVVVMYLDILFPADTENRSWGLGWTCSPVRLCSKTLLQKLSCLLALSAE
jgi:hypothetical protein